MANSLTNAIMMIGDHDIKVLKQVCERLHLQHNHSDALDTAKHVECLISPQVRPSNIRGFGPPLPLFGPLRSPRECFEATGQQSLFLVERHQEQNTVSPESYKLKTCEKSLEDLEKGICLAEKSCHDLDVLRQDLGLC